MTFDEVFKSIIETYNGPDISGITDAIDKIKTVADNMEATVPKTDFDELKGRYDSLDAKYRQRYIEENFGKQPGADTPEVSMETKDNMEVNASAMADEYGTEEEDEVDLVFGDL